MEKIAFIGLGHMGLPMAINLVKAGHTVYGYDLSPEALASFEEAGGHTVDALDALSVCHTFFTMLQTGEQVKAVCLSESGIFQVAPKGALFIDCSSIDVASARELHETAQSKGFDSLDAPVSGGVMGAENASLTFMVGGNDSTFQKAQPLLAQMGQKIVHAGGAGTGQAAKICNNMILGISMLGISEAFSLADKLGLKKEKLYEISSNASGQCWSMTSYCPVPGILPNSPASNDYQPGFTSQMMLKDLRLSQEASEKVNAYTPLGKTTCTLYETLVKSGRGELDFSSIIQLIEKAKP